MNIIIMLVCSVSIVQFASGQETIIKYDIARLYEDKNVTVVNRKVKLERDASKECIVLNEDVDEGLVWLDGVSFSEGTIEIDLKGQDVFQHSFLGIAFHGVNDSTFDAIYFRPFQFRTADSVRKTRGVQYVSLPKNTWQVLREKHPGVYEKTVHPAPDPNNWFHAKMVVRKNTLQVYVNDSPAPCLEVDLIGKREGGRIALYTADRSGGSFANLTIKGN